MTTTDWQSLRAYDEQRFHKADKTGFSIRKEPFSKALMTKLTLMGIIALLGTVIVVSNQSLLKIFGPTANILLYNDIFLVSMLFIVFGGMLYVVGHHVARYEQALCRQQFMSALFASSLAKGFQFACIASVEDAYLVYSSHDFQQLFPEVRAGANRQLDTLLYTLGASDTDRLPIVAAVKNAPVDFRELPLRIPGTGNDEGKSFILQISSISRPSGFCLIRGRKI